MRSLEVRAIDPSGQESSIHWVLGYSDFDLLCQLARWAISMPESSHWQLEIGPAEPTISGRFTLEIGRPLYRMANRICSSLQQPILDAECLWFTAMYAVRPAIAPVLEQVLTAQKATASVTEIVDMPNAAYASLASLLATSYKLHLVASGSTTVYKDWHLTPSMYLVMPERDPEEPVWTPILPPECSWSDVVPICMALSPTQDQILPYREDTSGLLPLAVDLQWDPLDTGQTHVLGLEPSVLAGLTYWWLHSHRMVRQVVWHDPVHFLILRYVWLRHPQVRQLIQQCGHYTSVQDLMQAMLLMKHYTVQAGDPVAHNGFDELASALGLSYIERRSLQLLVDECQRIQPDSDDLEQELKDLALVLQSAIDAADYLNNRLEEWR